MKNISKKNKIILLLLILLIIAGTIALFLAGFEKTVEYGAKTRLELYISKDYTKQEIEDIAKQSFNNKNFILEEIKQVNSATGTKVKVIGIKITDYSEEELNKFKLSICEKYDIKEDELELYEISLPTTRIRTSVEPYVFPVVLVTVLSLIYVLFKNLKSENKWKIILKIILILAIVLGIYFSLIIITRLPFGSYTMPLALAIYIITLIISVNNIKE